MDYKKIYESIIEKANSENREKGNGIYYESHHIVPKCLGGVSIDNLWEEKLGSEEALLKRKNRKEKISRRVTGEGNPLFGKAHSERAKSIMREKAINREVSDETKKKHSENYKRIFGTKERRESISKRNSGNGNPMHGRSAYDIWIEKYGLEEANHRKAEADLKRSEFWRKKRLENDRIRK